MKDKDESQVPSPEAGQILGRFDELNIRVRGVSRSRRRIQAWAGGPKRFVAPPPAAREFPG
jgi:ribosomal protein L19